MGTIERSYTVKELDALRWVVRDKYIWGSYSGPGGTGRLSQGYDETAMHKAVEETVRTHMLAGHTAQDLIDSEREAFAALSRARTGS